MEGRSWVGIVCRLVVFGFVLSFAPLAFSETNAATSASTPIQTVDPTVLKWSGNLRHRFDSVRNESPSAGKNETYDQMRLRLRLGAMASPLENLKIEMRLATGTGGTSTNQSYGDTVKGSRNYDFKLDRAAFDYGVNDFIHVGGGRMANPLVLVGENDMLFDSDLNFDGTTILLGQNWGDVELGASAGLFILDESKDTSAAMHFNSTPKSKWDGWMWSPQQPGTIMSVFLNTPRLSRATLQATPTAAASTPMAIE